MMPINLIYTSVLLFSVVIITETADEDGKETNTREVNDVVNLDYALSKIPVYFVSNQAISENKVPIAVIPGVYPPTAFLNTSPIKDKKRTKNTYYAAYKTPKITPIHEPSIESYTTAPSETPLSYAIPYQSNANAENQYKLSLIGKDYQTGTSYIKYETTPKPLHSKYQTSSNNNVYASFTPLVSYASEQTAYATPKKLTYDYVQPSSHQIQPTQHVQAVHQSAQPVQPIPQIQYYIKYVPVPYISQPHEQYISAPETSYITQKPAVTYKSSNKQGQAAQDVNSVSPVSYPVSNDADSAYSTSAPEETAYPVYYKSYPYQQQQQQPTYKSYSKKYVPTSYVLASIGKTAPTQYSSSIQHESIQENTYTTKLAPVPLPVDKYVAQSNDGYKSQLSDESNSYTAEKDYYEPASNNIKYKEQLISLIPQLVNYDYTVPRNYHQSLYHKKDTKIHESSTQKA